jgi:hypothetical protein
MKYFILAIALLLTGCTTVIDIPEDKHGVLLRFGEIRGSVAGPAKLHKTVLIEHIVLINKVFELKVNEGQYAIRYKVTDPERYFRMMGGNRSILVLLERELAKRSLKGEAVHSEEQLLGIIKSVDLPIIVVKEPNQAFNRTATPLRYLAAR